MPAVIAGAVALLVAGCTSTAPSSPDAGSGSSSEVFPDSSVEGAIGQLPHRSISAFPESRLADGLVPPTNRWFSGLVFNAVAEPVYPLPLSFGLSESGFDFGVPPVTVGTDTITSPHVPAVAVEVSGSASSEVTDYDDASVTIGFRDGSGGTLGSVTVAQGSPLVSFTAQADTELTLPSAPDVVVDGVWQLGDGTPDGSDFGLITDGTLERTSIALGDGDTATWIAAPPDGDIAELAEMAGPVDGVTLAYAVDDAAVTTNLDYGADTLIAAMPHQQGTLTDPATCDLGTYATAYGTMTLCAARELSWTAPRLHATASLDLSALSDDQRNELAAQVAADAAVEAKLPADTYFGGKALYRLANLLDLAEQLDEERSSEILADRLGTALREWTRTDGCEDGGERCFVYDDAARGIVGVTASFGSDAFNDHHFHYGYFLYAASVASTYDSDLADEIAPVIDLLAADLATSGDSSYFPERRVFDAYASHSWASGYVPFRDGNNQESSSEAVTAWNGLSLWADVTGNGALAVEADWMLSSEAASANAYWTDFDRTDPVYDGYSHSIASINWGAKRDYSTWFSAEPNAKLGIVTLPMSPVAGYLATDPSRISENLAEGAPSGFEVQYGDYLLMYSSLQGPAEAEASVDMARDFPEELIDDASSRSYLLAFVLSQTGG